MGGPGVNSLETTVAALGDVWRGCVCVRLCVGVFAGFLFTTHVSPACSLCGWCLEPSTLTKSSALSEPVVYTVNFV